MKINIKGLNQISLSYNQQHMVQEIIQQQVFTPEFLLKFDMLIDAIQYKESRLRDAEQLLDNLQSMLQDKDVAAVFIALSIKLCHAYEQIFVERNDDGIKVK